MISYWECSKIEVYFEGIWKCYIFKTIVMFILQLSITIV